MPDDQIKEKMRSRSTPLPATTTEEEDTVTAGQRRINLIWETTQAQIAKVSIYTALFVNSAVVILLIIFHKDISTAMIVVVMACLASMNTTMGIIIGFYFSRTNHSAIGGVGKKKAISDDGTR
jgi:hypothetical protein